MQTTTQKYSRPALGILQIFVGIGAIPAGMMFILQPDGAGIVPVDALAGSPFPNFLVPGIFLLLVNGIGSLTGAYLTFRRHPLAGWAGMGLGLFLVLWIVIQVSILGWPPHWLQILYFILGAVELGLGKLYHDSGQISPANL